ncbi:response regulator transcription factor [Levyella massiliensis]|uniref:response regulator transcription factor n=1 Tax=Levyella massiliensis TaxID=938289 RepID=UPI0023EF85FB|nr:response regulator transcription factor [Levyella massiliensis]
MEPRKILLVEDEEGIINIEKAYLEKAGFQVEKAMDGNEALEQYTAFAPDLVVLDLMLPKKSGEEVLQSIKEQKDTPVIIVSAKSEEDDRVENLRNGADDYMVKPFSARELVERVRAILRRTPSREDEKMLQTADGRLRIDIESMRTFVEGKEVHLTKNEFLIVQTLFTHPNKIYTRDEIIEVTFGMDYEAFDRAIDTHIKNIRQKIEADPKTPIYIRTVYGVGYRAGGFDEA